VMTQNRNNEQPINYDNREIGRCNYMGFTQITGEKRRDATFAATTANGPTQKDESGYMCLVKNATALNIDRETPIPHAID
jgi:hypothetical protein